jgi:DNA-binding response OmpR family regulator
MAERILVIEDETTIQAVIRRILGDAGFKITWAPNGQAAIHLLKTISPDLVILDLVLPDISGAEVCAHIRRNPATRSVPILILTGCTTAGLPAECLNAGADDFLPKPFDAKELLARAQAILRRPRLYITPDGTIEGGSLRILTGSRDIFFQGQKMPALTPKEFNLMKALVLHSPVVLSKAELARLAWSEPSELLHPRTLDVHIRRIRLKFGPLAAQGLKTIPAVGYQWVEPLSAPHEN